jgi:hypothetical protein
MILSKPKSTTPAKPKPTSSFTTETAPLKALLESVMNFMPRIPVEIGKDGVSIVWMDSSDTVVVIAKIAAKDMIAFEHTSEQPVRIGWFVKGIVSALKVGCGTTVQMDYFRDEDSMVLRFEGPGGSARDEAEVNLIDLDNADDVDEGVFEYDASFTMDGSELKNTIVQGSSLADILTICTTDEGPTFSFRNSSNDLIKSFKRTVVMDARSRNASGGATVSRERLAEEPVVLHTQAPHANGTGCFGQIGARAVHWDKMVNYILKPLASHEPVTVSLGQSQAFSQFAYRLGPMSVRFVLGRVVEEHLPSTEDAGTVAIFDSAETAAETATATSTSTATATATATATEETPATATEETPAKSDNPATATLTTATPTTATEVATAIEGATANEGTTTDTSTESTVLKGKRKAVAGVVDAKRLCGSAGVDDHGDAVVL